MKRNIMAILVAGSILLTSCASSENLTDSIETTAATIAETVATTAESEPAITESSIQIYSDNVEEEPPVFILDYEVVTISDSEGNYDLDYSFEESKSYQFYAEVSVDDTPVIYEFSDVSLYAYTKIEVISIDEKVYLKIDNEDLIPGKVYEDDVMLLVITPEPTPTPTPKPAAKPAQNADSGCLGGDAMTF